MLSNPAPVVRLIWLTSTLLTRVRSVKIQTETSGCETEEEALPQERDRNLTKRQTTGACTAPKQARSAALVKHSAEYPQCPGFEPDQLLTSDTCLVACVTIGIKESSHCSEKSDVVTKETVGRRKGWKEGGALAGCGYSPQDMCTVDLRFSVQTKPDLLNGLACSKGVPSR
jgi:hypothetical protein